MTTWIALILGLFAPLVIFDGHCNRYMENTTLQGQIPVDLFSRPNLETM